MSAEVVRLPLPQTVRSVKDALALAESLDLPNAIILSEMEDRSLVQIFAPDMSKAEAVFLLERSKARLLMPHTFERA